MKNKNRFFTLVDKMTVAFRDFLILASIRLVSLFLGLSLREYKEVGPELKISFDLLLGTFVIIVIGFLFVLWFFVSMSDGI
jgi:hypothetical protein